MYDVIYTGQFKKSLRLCVKRGLDIQAFTTAPTSIAMQACHPTPPILCSNKHNSPATPIVKEWRGMLC